MVGDDPTEALGLYMDWLRRRLPGWVILAECPEGQVGFLYVDSRDTAIPPRHFWFPNRGEAEAMARCHTWLMDLHRAGKLPSSPLGEW